MRLNPLLSLGLLLPVLCFAKLQIDYPFQNVSLSWDERVNNLVSLLTIPELVEQLAKGGVSPLAGPAPAIDRLGIPRHSWDTECGRGVANSGPATSFPQPIGTAASFNRHLVYSIAEATAKELRAKYENNTAHSQYGTNMGLTCLSPVVNIMRHPFWGRSQETYGEDPFLTGEMGATFVRGIQGDHPRYLRAGGGCKHFNVHGGPENYPLSRYEFNAKVSERDWRTTFLPAFYNCIVNGGSVSTMCSYNSINGVPACANKKLLTDILRKEWNFTGYVIADQDAMENIVEWFKWVPTMEEAAAKSLIAGTNLGISTNNPNSTFTYLPKALDKKLVTPKQIRDAAKPLFHVRMRLGEFDPPELNPYSSAYSLSLIQSAQHQAVSLKAAMQGFVLLRNRNSVLPLQNKRYEAISVVGPMADNGKQLFGIYSATYDTQHVKTPLTSLKEMADQVFYADGCSGSPRCRRYKSKDVINAVQQINTQLVVVCLGTGAAVEQEGLDRQDLDLPGKQQDLLNDVIIHSGDIPIIVLLFTASPVYLDPELSVDAIVECFFPAQTTGEAIRRILWNEGPDSNPAGRLPFTWQASTDQVPDMVDYSMVNRTYRYWEMDSPAYPFGYGLSYTKFEYSDLKIANDQPKIGDDVRFEVTVTNKGPYDGDEVMQAYISWVNPPEEMPKIQLVAFERPNILQHDTWRWSGNIKASQMAVYLDQTGYQQIKGDIMLYVGGQQPNQKVNVGSNVLQAKITVT